MMETYKIQESVAGRGRAGHFSLYASSGRRNRESTFITNNTTNPMEPFLS